MKQNKWTPLIRETRVQFSPYQVRVQGLRTKVQGVTIRVPFLSPAVIYSSRVREELGNATERAGKERRFDLWARTDLLLRAGSKLLVSSSFLYLQSFFSISYSQTKVQHTNSGGLKPQYQLSQVDNNIEFRFMLVS